MLLSGCALGRFGGAVGLRFSSPASGSGAAYGSGCVDWGGECVGRLTGCKAVWGFCPKLVQKIWRFQENGGKWREIRVLQENGGNRMRQHQGCRLWLRSSWGGWDDDGHREGSVGRNEGHGERWTQGANGVHGLWVSVQALIDGLSRGTVLPFAWLSLLPLPIAFRWAGDHVHTFSGRSFHPRSVWEGQEAHQDHAWILMCTHSQRETWMHARQLGVEVVEGEEEDVARSACSGASQASGGS